MTTKANTNRRRTTRSGTMTTDFARATAAAACKEAYRTGAGRLDGEALMSRLLEEASLYDTWTLHVDEVAMRRLLSAEWRKLRGRQLGGHVTAASRA